MSAKAVPCWTIVCDLCGDDAMDFHGEFSGYVEIGQVEAYAGDLNWLCLDGIDICDHHVQWAEDNVGGKCYSCDDDDTEVWAGNCSECWEKAVKK